MRSFFLLLALASIMALPSAAVAETQWELLHEKIHGLPSDDTIDEWVDYLYARCKVELGGTGAWCGSVKTAVFTTVVYCACWADFD